MNRGDAVRPSGRVGGGVGPSGWADGWRGAVAGSGGAGVTRCNGGAGGEGSLI